MSNDDISIFKESTRESKDARVTRGMATGVDMHEADDCVVLPTPNFVASEPPKDSKLLSSLNISKSSCTLFVSTSHCILEV